MNTKHLSASAGEKKGCVNMANNKLENLMNSTMDNIRQMVDVNTIIGEPVICPDGTVIIPVSRVSYGFASGGSDLPPKTNTQKEFFGGGSGAGVSIQPVACLVVNNGNVKMLNMEFDGAVDRVISMIPEVADKVGDLFKKFGKKKESDDDTVKKADTVTETKAQPQPNTASADYSEAADIDDDF